MNTKESLIITAYQLGQLQSNCYVVSDRKTDDTIIIDPGDMGTYVAEEIERKKGKPVAVLLTHGHFDHVMGAAELQAIYSIPCFMDNRDQFLLNRMQTTAAQYLGRNILERPPSITALNFEKNAYGSIRIQSIHTPGHTPGSVSFYLPDKGVMFTGDTMFAQGLVGSTNHTYSRPLALRDSLASICDFPDTTIVYPGHGEMTILDDEKKLYAAKKNV